MQDVLAGVERILSVCCELCLMAVLELEYEILES